MSLLILQLSYSIAENHIDVDICFDVKESMKKDLSAHHIASVIATNSTLENGNAFTPQIAAGSIKSFETINNNKIIGYSKDKRLEILYSCSCSKYFQILIKIQKLL